MRSVGAAVVMVLMVLRTASQSETTSPPPPPTTQCPDLSSCSGTCYVDDSNLFSGCPTCICMDSGCLFSVKCGPDERCVDSDEPPYGVCVPNHETTSPSPPPTTQCPDLSSCSGTCYVDHSNLFSGCPTCICMDAGCLFSVKCGPDERCVESDEPHYGVCVPNHETTSPSPPPTTQCPDLSSCSGTCYVDDSNLFSGCPTCICMDSGCLFSVKCGPDERCVDSDEPPYGVCVPNHETTSPSPPPTTQCPDLSSCSGTCYVDDSNLFSGCPTCICLDSGCLFSVNCGPDERCVDSDEPPYGVCVPNHETTKETVTSDEPETSWESDESEESGASGLPTELITGTSGESWESEESGASGLPTESIREPCLTQTDPCTA